MSLLNHDLCLSYINRHMLKGVDYPMPLYRLARSAIYPGLARFDELVMKLVRDNAGHCAEILDYLKND